MHLIRGVKTKYMQIEKWGLGGGGLFTYKQQRNVGNCHNTNNKRLCSKSVWRAVQIKIRLETVSREEVFFCLLQLKGNLSDRVTYMSQMLSWSPQTQLGWTEWGAMRTARIRSPLVVRAYRNMRYSCKQQGKTNCCLEQQMSRPLADRVPQQHQNVEITIK